MAKYKVLVTERVMKAIDFYGAFTPAEYELVSAEGVNDPVLKEVTFAYGVVPKKNWLAAMPNLKFVQMAGVGYVEEAIRTVKEHGVRVSLTPEGTCLGVAEHTILLMLALYKHLVQAHRTMQEGKWIHEELRKTSYFLYDKVVGIVGLGRIGLEVVQRLRGFLPGRIVYYDLFRKKPAQEQELGVEFLELDDLLTVSDIVTLHVFLSDESRGMIGKRELELMKPGAVLINTSRGPVVDEEALYHILKDHRIWGAGLDAWTEEPTPPDNPILQLDNVVCTPHMATGTVDADRMKFQAAIANYGRILKGEKPHNEIERVYSEL